MTPEQIKQLARQKLIEKNPEMATAFAMQDLNEKLSMAKGDKGEPGYTPIKGIDYKDGEDGYTPIKGVDYFDGETPSKEELISLIEPLIPAPIPGEKGEPGESIKGDKGDSGSPDTPEQIAQKLNTLKEVLDISVIKGALTLENLKGKLDISDIKNWNQPAKGRLDQRWHGGGLSKVSHDTTLLGDGTPQSPLKVVDRGYLVNPMTTLGDMIYEATTVQAIGNPVDDFPVSIGDSQAFANSVSSKLSSYRMYGQQFGAPTGNMYAKLYYEKHTTAYGVDSVPDTSRGVIATSDPLDSSLVSSSFGAVDFTFSGSNKVTLSANTKYVMVIDDSAVDFGGGIILFGYVTIPSGYGNASTTNDQITWSVLTGYAFYFSVLAEPFATRLPIGTVGQVLTVDSSGIPQWQNDVSPTGYWTQAAGKLYPTTSTDRVLIGGATDDTSSFLQVFGSYHGTEGITSVWFNHNNAGQNAGEFQSGDGYDAIISTAGTWAGYFINRNFGYSATLGGATYAGIFSNGAGTSVTFVDSYPYAINSTGENIFYGNGSASSYSINFNHYTGPADTYVAKFTDTSRTVVLADSANSFAINATGGSLFSAGLFNVYLADSAGLNPLGMPAAFFTGNTTGNIGLLTNGYTIYTSGQSYFTDSLTSPTEQVTLTDGAYSINVTGQSHFTSSGYSTLDIMNGTSALAFSVPSFWAGELGGSGGAAYFNDAGGNNVYLASGTYAINSKGQGIFYMPDGTTTNFKWGFTDNNISQQSVYFHALTDNYFNMSIFNDSRWLYGPDGTSITMGWGSSNANIGGYGVRFYQPVLDGSNYQSLATDSRTLYDETGLEIVRWGVGIYALKAETQSIFFESGLWSYDPFSSESAAVKGIGGTNNAGLFTDDGYDTVRIINNVAGLLTGVKIEMLTSTNYALTTNAMVSHTNLPTSPSGLSTGDLFVTDAATAVANNYNVICQV